MGALECPGVRHHRIVFVLFWSRDHTFSGIDANYICQVQFFAPDPLYYRSRELCIGAGLTGIFPDQFRLADGLFPQILAVKVGKL